MQIYGIEICKVHKPSRDSQRVIARNRFYWLVFVLQLVAKWRFKFIIDVPYRPPLLLIYINGRSQVRFSNQSILIRHFLLANCMQLNKRSSTIANSTNGWSRKKTHVHLFCIRFCCSNEKRGEKRKIERVLNYFCSINHSGTAKHNHHLPLGLANFLQHFFFRVKIWPNANFLCFSGRLCRRCCDPTYAVINPPTPSLLHLLSHFILESIRTPRFFHNDRSFIESAENKLPIVQSIFVAKFVSAEFQFERR